MAKSYDILEKILYNLKEKCNNFRILIISDGKLDDQEETKKKGELLYEINTKLDNWIINYVN